MLSRTCSVLFFVTASLFAGVRGYGQAAGPGCTAQFYQGSYGLSGNLTFQSLVIGPDGSMYMGCGYGYNYSIIKLDSLGDTVRCRTYINGNAYNPGSKTILDYDGNLFSVTSNNYMLRTDTAGNVLSTKQLYPISDNTSSSLGLIDMGMLTSGDKVFLFNTYINASQTYLLVTTSPDAGTVKWIKYFTAPGNLSYGTAALLVNGDKVLVGYSFKSYQAPSGSVILQFDAGNGNVLQQHCYTTSLYFHNISRYNGGYIFSGITGSDFAGDPSFYIRTDDALNIVAARYFPSFSGTSSMVFRAQADGSVYGIYSPASPMTLFFIDARDSIEWASSIFSFYQVPRSLVFGPSGLYMASEWGATDVVTGGPISGLVLDKGSYSGYFPSCLNPAPATVNLAVLPLTASPPLGIVRDTSGIFTSANFATQEINGPAVGIGNNCLATSYCNSVALIGDPAVCSGSGKFTGRRNAGCVLPVNWAVTRGPGKATLQTLNDSTVSVSFDKNGDYMLASIVNTSCASYGDSVLVHVNTGAPLFLGNDTVLCTGDSLVLQAGTGYSSYTWQDGSAADSFTVKTPGLYSVSAQDYCGHSLSSQINVSSQAAASSPFPATNTKCVSDTLSLPEPAGFTGFAFVAPAAGAAVRNGQLQFFSQTAATYHVQEKDAHGCRVASDITVNLYPQPVIHIGNDTTICPGDSVELNAGSGFFSYTWNTGSPDAAIWVSAGNQYSVRAMTPDGCSVRDTMILANWVAPVVTLDHDTVLCAGSSRLLTAGNGFAAYQWNDGSISPDLEISEKGFYRVIVTDDHGCIASDSTTIRAIIPLPANFMPDDTTICQYGKLVLTPKGSFSSYSWNDGSKGPSLTVSQPGLYYVQVTDKYNCPGSDSIFLTGKQCMEGFYIPNAFTPNGDGKNDVFRPLIFGNVEKYHFTIFNRNGQKVYESSTLQNGWDGTFHGVAQPSGVFVWYCVYQLQGQQSQTQKGTLLIIR